MATPTNGGYYSPGNIFKQEPAVIVGVIQGILAALVVAGVVDWSAEVVAGVIAAVGLVLNLLYVRSTVVPTSKT